MWMIYWRRTAATSITLPVQPMRINHSVLASSTSPSSFARSDPALVVIAVVPLVWCFPSSLAPSPRPASTCHLNYNVYALSESSRWRPSPLTPPSYVSRPTWPMLRSHCEIGNLALPQRRSSSVTSSPCSKVRAIGILRRLGGDHIPSPPTINDTATSFDGITHACLCRYSLLLPSSMSPITLPPSLIETRRRVECEGNYEELFFHVHWACARLLVAVEGKGGKAYRPLHVD